MSAGDISLQIENMKGVFEEVEKAVVDNWWFAEVANHLETQDTLHAANTQKIEGYATERKTKIKSINKRIVTEGNDQKQTLELKKNELSSVRNNADELLRRREKLTESLQELRKQNKERDERLELQKKVSKIEREEHQKASSFFHERLGLKLNKVKGGWMEVVFTQICKVDPTKPFFFTCRVNEQKVYEVGECDPAVKDFQSLTNKLNETNNLRSFIIEMRHQFKEYAETHRLS